jgi:hypothetical protein
MTHLLSNDAQHRLCVWLTGNDTGLSSRFMARTIMGGAQERDEPDHPWDPADFGRCHRLLEAVPELRKYLSLLRDKSAVWDRLIEHWDEMTALYLVEAPKGTAPMLYELMQSLTRPSPTSISSPPHP